MRSSAKIRSVAADAVPLAVGALALALTPATAPAATPQPLPTAAIDGFTFPTSEATLTAQIATMNGSASADERTKAATTIYRHGWGLWTALTSLTSQRYEGQSLRVYETWLSIDDLVAATDGSTDAAPAAHATPAVARAPHRLGLLRVAEPAEVDDTGAASAFSQIIGTIKFDPTAATHIVQQQLLSTAALDTLRAAGAPQIPPFPSTATIAKPIYRIVSTHDLVAGRYALLKVWSGPPATLQIWGPDRWTSGIWIDLRNGGSGSGAVDSTLAPDGSSRAEATTYPLANFVHHVLSPADAAALNATVPGSSASAGDVALLVGMHVATRETTRWTWQTFWWTPAPDDPPSPSSSAMAAARPAQLQGAPRHYAMALAYSMLSPEQPYTGGSNTTPAVYAYNPWIEAHFGPADLPDSQAGVGPDGQPAGNNYGVQTNCMSCHAQATFHAAALTTAPRFTGARYVDLIDPAFVGALQTDFVWALSRHAH